MSTVCISYVHVSTGHTRNVAGKQWVRMCVLKWRVDI